VAVQIVAFAESRQRSRRYPLLLSPVIEVIAERGADCDWLYGGDQCLSLDYKEIPFLGRPEEPGSSTAFFRKMNRSPIPRLLDEFRKKVNETVYRRGASYCAAKTLSALLDYRFLYNIAISQHRMCDNNLLHFVFPFENHGI